MIMAYKKDEPNYDEWLAWGNDILTTGIFAIIVCGTLGVIAIHFTSTHLLEKAEEQRPLRRPSPAVKGPRAAPVAIAAGAASDDGSVQPPAGMPRRPSSAGPLSIDGSTVSPRCSLLGCGLPGVASSPFVQAHSRCH